MVIYAIFMCLQQPRPIVGQNCIMLSERPHPTREGLLNGTNGAYTNLEQCEREFSIYRPARGYYDVCLKKEVPGWEPSQ
jgi:hypothetical protein